MRNVNTVQWESRNTTTQTGVIDDRKSEVIAFVVNTGINVAVDNVWKTILCLKHLLFFNWISVGNISGICFSNSGLPMVNIIIIVKIWRGIVKLVYIKPYCLDLWMQYSKYKMTELWFCSCDESILRLVCSIEWTICFSCWSKKR